MSCDQTTHLMCTVHIERNLTERKHKDFIDPDNASKVNVDLERLKNDSVNVLSAWYAPCLSCVYRVWSLLLHVRASSECAPACVLYARVGKRLLVQKWIDEGEPAGAAYLANWLERSCTYAEANARMPSEPDHLVEATIPTQSNAIERQNLDQKQVAPYSMMSERAHQPWVVTP